MSHGDMLFQTYHLKNRLFQVCDLREVEDESHFIICCTLLKQPHETLFSDLSEIYDTDFGINSNDLFQLIMTAKDYDKASIPPWYGKRTKFTESGSRKRKMASKLLVKVIRLIFAQNLSQFGRAFNKMLGKVYPLPTFPSKWCFICLLGSYFCSLNALFGSPVWGNVCRAAILFVYTWRSVARTLQKIP